MPYVTTNIQLSGLICRGIFSKINFLRHLLCIQMEVYNVNVIVGNFIMVQFSKIGLLIQVVLYNFCLFKI